MARNYNMKYHIEHFLEMMLAEKHASNNTITSYKADLLSFSKFLQQDLSDIKLEQVTSQHVEQYIINLGQKFKATTVSRKLSAIRHFFDFLVSDNILSENCSLKVSRPKKEKLIPKALTQEEIEKLLTLSHQDETNEGVRLCVMLEILYSTGMRISELISLSKRHMFKGDNDNMMYMIVKGKGQKERVVILNEDTVETIASYMKLHRKFARGRETDLLFPSFDKKGKLTCITRQRFGQMLKILAGKAGINAEKVSPHKIRHSFATHLVQNGADLRVVQELLGHSDISSTQIYTKVFSDKARKLLVDKHPLSNS